MTGIDIGIQLYQLLNGKTMARVWQHNRPKNSDKTDIVISVPEYNAGGVNSGYVDVNIFTPNVVVKIDGKDDSTFPNMAVFKPILDATLPHLTTTPNYNLDVRIPGIPVRDKDGNWYINIRLGFEGVDSGEATDVELWRMTSVDDGFGGAIVTSTNMWEGKAVQQNIGNGTQLNINVGRYEFNLRCDWLIPSSVAVQKNWQLRTDYEVYVINGISPKGSYTLLSCVRKDFNDAD